MTPDGRRRLLLCAFYATPLLAATLLRLTLPDYLEFESQEATLRGLTIVEKGEVPLYGIGNIRFLGAALGPLIYYVKAIPYLFTRDPAGEFVMLWLLHLAAMVASMLYVRSVVAHRIGLPDLAGRPGPALLPLPDLAAVATGFAMTLSVHALGGTSVPHPAYLAATVMPWFLLGIHRYLVEGSRGWLAVGSLAFGIMSQFYQMALFAPLLAGVAWLLVPRKPARGDLLAGLLPLLLCYLPYLASELATSFFNTRQLFTFQPTAGDQQAVRSNVLYNLGYVWSAMVTTFGLPPFLYGIVGLLGLAGLGDLVRASLRTRAPRTLMALLLVYVLLPSLLLDAPRFQLIQPALPFLVAWGAIVLVLRGTEPLRTSARRARRAALAAGLVVGALLLSIGPLSAIPGSVEYCRRITPAHPWGGLPDLASTRAVLTELNRRLAIDLPGLYDRVHSPVVNSGLYADAIVLRSLEVDPPKPDAHRPGPALFVHDPLFPYDLAGTLPGRPGGYAIAPLEPRFREVRRTLECDGEWCAELAGTHPAEPRQRFFWGCDSLRDLDARIPLPESECEAVVTMPVHSRTYAGDLVLPPPPPGCADCAEVLFLTLSPECKASLRVDDVDVDVLWHRGYAYRYGLVQLEGPAARPGEHRFELRLDDCVPAVLDLVSFTGVPRFVRTPYDPPPP